MNLQRFGLIFTMCFLLSSCVSTKYIPIEAEPYLLPALTDIMDVEEFDFVGFLETFIDYIPTEVQESFIVAVSEADTAFTLNLYIYTSQIIQERLWEIKVHEINGSYTKEKYEEEYLRYITSLDKINNAIKKLKPLLNE